MNRKEVLEWLNNNPCPNCKGLLVLVDENIKEMTADGVLVASNKKQEPYARCVECKNKFAIQQS